MRRAAICTVSGCARAHWAKGLCSAHYQRVRKHGGVGPASVSTGKGERLSWLRSMVGHIGDECLAWPFCIEANGYGAAEIGRKKMGAHRAMCILAHGDPSDARMQAAHSCGNRSCVNPNHLRWATAAQNINEKRAHGTMPLGEKVHNAKLTRRAVAEAKRMRAGGASYQQIADCLEVNRTTVARACNGETWSHAD